MNLLDIIKKNKNLRKIFGKQELKIIEKQLLGIELKPSERTRLSRDIRKKFIAIKELSAFVNEFELKKGAVIKEKIQEAKEAILESKYFSIIREIVLFGSYVENQATFHSDIDLAVKFSEINKSEAMEFRIKALSKSPEKVDIQVYNILPEKIKKEIDKKGKIIWKKE